MYTDSGLEEQVATGKLFPLPMRPYDDRPAPARANQAPGARSQRIRYVNGKVEIVVVVHRYIAPDDSIGASGKPDPKQLRIDGVIYWC
jgi:hypothetical protein